jgi:uncharacterized protein (TIGR01244 family)
MAEFRPVTDQLSVAGQIDLADFARAAQLGFKLAINNRPDDEEAGQPSHDQIEAAARAAGLDYVFNPIRGGPNSEQVSVQLEAVEAATGPVLAFCRSGTRSITAWALGQAASGAKSRSELVELGHAAGYDLSGALMA